jgi:hypothetical protein
VGGYDVHEINVTVAKQTGFTWDRKAAVPIWASRDLNQQVRGEGDLT